MTFCKKGQIAFQSVYTILHHHQQWKSVPISPHLQQYLIFLMFWISVFLWDVSWYPIICFDLFYLAIPSLQQYWAFCICLFTIWTSYLVRYLFISFYQCNYTIFFNVEFRSFLCIIFWFWIQVLFFFLSFIFY